MGTEVPGKGNRAEIWDYIDLLLLRVAKIRRRKLRTSEQVAAFYDEFFNENDVEVMSSGRDLRRSSRAEVLTTAAWTRMPANAKVLDVGCGMGDNLRYILRQEASFFGLEYAQTTALSARRVLGERATLCVGSATKIPFGENEFDLIVCIEVLEHIEGDEEACREIARVLKRNGALILSLPYRHWFPVYFQEMGHIRHYTKADVEEMLSRAGLTITEFLPNFPVWSRYANYIYVTCRIYALLLRLVGIRHSPVEARLPFTRRPLMGLMFSMLEHIRQREQTLDYANLQTSTFVVAEKR